MAKKKRGNKAKSNNNNNNKLLAISIITLFVFTFALNFVDTSVDNPSIADYEVGLAIVLEDPGGDTTNKFWGWVQKFILEPFEKGGGVDAIVAKYLLFFVVTIFLWSVLSFAKIPKNFFAQFLIVVPVAYLSIVYITPAEIFSILTTYTALGMTLSVIVPFFAILLTSSMLLSSESVKQMSVGKVMLQVVLWFFYIGYLIYKLIGGYEEGKDMSTAVNFITGGILLMSLLILYYNKLFRKWLFSVGIELRNMQIKDAKKDQEEDQDAADSEGI